MFNTLIVKPIFNLLVVIYSIIPGHNFGLAIIIFTIIARWLMWPLVKKQLHHARAMREIQPELKRIKKAAAGDRQKESLMMMELYKERQVNPFSSLGIMLVQLPIIFGLYIGLSKIVKNPQQIIDFSYDWVRHLGWMKDLAADITKFNDTNNLFGFVDLGRSAVGKSGGGVYLPAMLIVVGSALIQYFQSKQLMPKAKDGRNLRAILKDAATGKNADSTEVNAATGRAMSYFIPAIVFLVTINIAAALPLYWLTSGLIAYWQQARILKKDDDEMDQIADKTGGKATARAKKAIEAEIVEDKTISKKPKNVKKSAPKSNKKGK